MSHAASPIVRLRVPGALSSGRRARHLAASRLFGPLLHAVLILAVSLLWPALAIAQAVQPVPALSARVVDRSNTLAAQQVEALEAKLAAFEAERGTQIVVLIVSTSAPEDIASYAFRVADAWKIGRREIGDGILVVVAKNDRRIRIEVARALEGAVPDVAAFRIIDRVITPAFRENDFAGGLERGVDALMALIRGEALPLPEPARAAGENLSLEDLGAFLFIAVPVAGAVLVGVLGRKIGALVTGGAAGFVIKVLTGSLLLAGVGGVVALVLVLALGIGGGGGGSGGGGLRRGGPIIWGGGGSRGGGGGGGFSSGGGGSFGGGGASGSW